MRATQNQRVAALCQQRLDPPHQHGARFGTAQIACLDALDQAGTRLSDDPHICGKAIEQRGEAGA